MTIVTVNHAVTWNALWIAGVVAGLSSGCACHSALEEDFGKSVKQMQYVQTYDKAAILDPQLEPVEGLEGGAAVHALEEYRNTFRKPTEEPVKQELIFNIGSNGGGGQ